ncbi:MAG: cyclic nucleotide-binding domain-containing protein [Polyangiaceae bacterium]
MLDIKARGLSDAGKARKGNEDAIALDEARGIFLLADGMGGHENGDVASKAAIATAHERLLAALSTFERFRDDPGESTRDAALAAMVDAFQKTCAHVYGLGREGQTSRRMGSTLDAIVRVGDRVVLGHVGDGRVHLVRGGRVYFLTEDHTLLGEQLRAGVVTEEQVRESHLRGVLTRCIGTHQSVKVDTLILDLFPGDRLLMCTDGLHQYLAGRDLLDLLGPEGGDVGKLVAHANAAGGSDNISVLLLECAAHPVAAKVSPARADASAEPPAGPVSLRIDAICRLPLFQHLDYREQVAVLSVAHSRKYEAGETIVRQGSPGTDMFIVVVGQLVVERDGVNLAELGPGGHFGEMSLIDGSPRSATVVAHSATDVLSIGRAELDGLIRRDPVFGLKVLGTFVQALSARLRSTSANLTGLEHAG